MNKDLTNSTIDRQNLLNNQILIKEIQNELNIKGILFENELKFTKKQLSDFFEIDERTIERYLSKYETELSQNGYEILKGKKLKAFIENYNIKVGDINVGDIQKTIPSLSVFSFRAMLNLGMILTESEKAKMLRSMILDVFIDILNEKTKGKTKYINQRDEDFIDSCFQETTYRKDFTNALNNYVVSGKFKYDTYTDKIYISIFKEKSKEYKKILDLNDTDVVRDTLYSEVLDIIASYECGLAQELKKEFQKKGNLLEYIEVDKIFKDFEEQPLWIPLIKKARTKMASRDTEYYQDSDDEHSQKEMKGIELRINI